MVRAAAAPQVPAASCASPRGEPRPREEGMRPASTARLTAGEGLRQDLGGEGCPGTGVVALVLEELLSQHVAPAAVQEAVQDVGGDDLGQRQPRRFQPRLEHQGLRREHRAHHGRPGARRRRGTGGRADAGMRRAPGSTGAKVEGCDAGGGGRGAGGGRGRRREREARRRPGGERTRGSAAEGKRETGESAEVAEAVRKDGSPGWRRRRLGVGGAGGCEAVAAGKRRRRAPGRALASRTPGPDGLPFGKISAPL